MTGLKMRLNDINIVVKTPVFIYDETRINSNICVFRSVINDTKCHLLFSLKSFSIFDALLSMSQLIDGFSASSLFEVKLARHILGNHKSVHFTSPGLRMDEIEEISELSDFISFNSLSQLERYYNRIGSKLSCGIRVNPQLSFVKDSRYNPCRKNSRLGVPLTSLKKDLIKNSKVLKNIEGVHFHTNCESSDFYHLLTTVKHIDAHIPYLLERIDWINVGGGYLFNNDQNYASFIEAIDLLKSRYDVEVFFEPGKGIIGDAGYIVSSVIDIFKTDGWQIAVLDTTVNHMPEVFEYQYKPDVMQESEDGKYSYILAGASCLAGDIFGQYRFDKHLTIGSKIVFEGLGAYTMVKANIFNGINLPSIFALTKQGKLELKKKFSYEDFKSRCGVDNNDLT